MKIAELDHPAKTHEVDVRDESFHLRHAKFVDPAISGREMIESLGYHPADDYIVLGYRPDGSLEEIGLEARIELEGRRREDSFFVNRAGETANLVIEGVRLTWTQLVVSGLTVKMLARVNPHKTDLFQIFNDAPHKLIHDEDMVDLRHRGVEHFAIKPAIDVDIIVNEKTVPIMRGRRTGLQIKQAAINAGVPIQLTFTLSEDKPGGKIIGDTDTVHIKGGESFLAIDDHDDS